MINHNYCFLKLQQLHPAAIRPTYANAGDMGMDLHSIEETLIPSGAWRLVPTGWAIELSNPDYCLQICSRSGLAAKFGVFVLNAPGIIDLGYRGEIKVVLANMGEEEYRVRVGDRIAQALVMPVLRVPPSHVLMVDQLSESKGRGVGGFGSTGF